VGAQADIGKLKEKDLKGLGCKLATSEVYEQEDCNGVRRERWLKDPTQALMDWLVGNWVVPV